MSCCAEIPGRRLDPALRDPVEVAQEQNRDGFTWRSNVRLWRGMRSA